MKEKEKEEKKEKKEKDKDKGDKDKGKEKEKAKEKAGFLLIRRGEGGDRRCLYPSSNRFITNVFGCDLDKEPVSTDLCLEDSADPVIRS